MLLIIFFGLIAQLALGSGDCDVGTRNVKDFDWTRFSDSRIWYWHWHSSSDSENNLDCVITKYGSPEGNQSLVTNDFYDKSSSSHITLYGNATNWNPTGYWDEVYQPANDWSGRCYVIAIDYDRYFIIKHCPFESNQPFVYVAYRSQNPDEATVIDVKKELQANNIDASTLAVWPANHCQ